MTHRGDECTSRSDPPPRPPSSKASERRRPQPPFAVAERRQRMPVGTMKKYTDEF